MNIERRLSNAVLALLATFSVVACGGGSSSAPTPPPPAPDTTVPTVSTVDAPAGTVNRTVELTVTASDNVGVSEVRFFVDGTLLGTVTATPYTIDWDTSGETEGDHELTAEAEDAAGNVATSAAATATVQNILTFDVTASEREEVPTSGSLATAQASFTINVATGDAEGTLTTSGITATAAHIHSAFAGSNGPVLVPLDQDPADASIFTVPVGSTLSVADVDELLAAGLYVNVHSSAFPGGEIRGQVLPDGFVLSFANLEGSQSVPSVDSVASGRAAVTLNQDTGALVVQAQVVDLPDADQAHVHMAYAGATGAVLVPLAQDPTDVGRWFAEGETLNTTGLDAFSSGQLYVNIHSPANPSGEIRGQIVPDGIAVLFATLSGLQEVPAVDTNASGIAAITLDEAGSLVTVHANTRGLSDASAAHLHNAFGGTNGAVEFGLTQDGSDPEHWFAEQETLDSVQLGAILAGSTYVNVHTPANSGGEVRGQVIPDDIVFAVGRLDGGQSVPAIASAAGGSFAVTANSTTNTVVAHANTSGADDATAAHIHDGYAGTNGGVAVGLTQDASDVTRWSAVDAPIDAAQLAALQSGRYYINIHTPANPAGEIRGQVAPAPIEVLFANMDGDQEVPPVATSANGIAATTVNLDTGMITVFVNASGVDDATASHIHTGDIGENGPVLIPLVQDLADPGVWSVSGEQLDSTSLGDYKSGGLYVNLHTPLHPGGEIRGQITPPDSVEPDTEAPTIDLASPGATVTNTVALTATASDNETVIAVRFFADGALIGSDSTAPYSVDWDTTTVANGDVTLTAEAEDLAGNIGDSTAIIVTVDNAAPVTLAQLQTQIFSASCSGCHSGPTSGNLPAGMNLSTTADSFAALVNVASLQVGSLNRVTPGDPDNSYLVQKLEGTATVGGRMPQGGPFLDQATVDSVRQWITDGALNN